MVGRLTFPTSSECYQCNATTYNIKALFHPYFVLNRIKSNPDHFFGVNSFALYTTCISNLYTIIHCSSIQLNGINGVLELDLVLKISSYFHFLTSKLASHYHHLVQYFLFWIIPILQAKEVQGETAFILLDII